MEFCGNRKNGTTYAEGAFENQIRNQSPRKTDRKQQDDDGDDGDNEEEHDDEDDEDDTGTYPIDPLLKDAQGRTAGPGSREPRAAGLGSIVAAEAVAGFEQQSHVAQGPFSELRISSPTTEHYQYQPLHYEGQQHYPGHDYQHRTEQQNRSEQISDTGRQHLSQQPAAGQVVGGGVTGGNTQPDPRADLKQKLETAIQALTVLLNGLNSYQDSL